MSRQNEEEQANLNLTTRKISAEGSIKALAPGASVIKDVWVEVGGQRVSEVLVGERFEILCDYKAENLAGGTWLSCVTVKGEGILNYEDTANLWPGTIISHTARLGNMGANIMPPGDGPLTLFIKLWLNDDVFAGYPPVEEW